MLEIEKEEGEFSWLGHLVAKEFNASGSILCLILF